MKMRLRVLVVEDNPLHLKLYDAWLSHAGHHAIMVADERMAHSTAIQQMPHIAIVDIRLPHISGFDIIRELKASSSTSAIPVLAVSVMSSESDKEACVAAGADRFMSKPVSMHALTDALVALTRPS